MAALLRARAGERAASPRRSTVGAVRDGAAGGRSRPTVIDCACAARTRRTWSRASLSTSKPSSAPVLPVAATIWATVHGSTATKLRLRRRVHSEPGALGGQAGRRTEHGSLLAEDVEQLVLDFDLLLELVDLALALGEAGVQHHGRQHQDAEQHDGQRGDVGGDTAAGDEVQLGERFELGVSLGDAGKCRRGAAAEPARTAEAVGRAAGSPAGAAAGRRCGASARRSRAVFRASRRRASGPIGRAGCAAAWSTDGVRGAPNTAHGRARRRTRTAGREGRCRRP